MRLDAYPPCSSTFYLSQCSCILYLPQQVCTTPLTMGPYNADETEIDEFQFAYSSANEPPHIKNDTITINKRQASDHQVGVGGVGVGSSPQMQRRH